jgi:hypothetical protein
MISESSSASALEVRFHHGTLGPIYQFRLRGLAMKVVTKLVSSDLAGDFHQVAVTLSFSVT